MTSRIDVGVDPDSSGHGVAIAADKILCKLCTMRLIDIYSFIVNSPDAEIHFHIEDVNKKKSIFKKKGVKNQKSELEVARSVGMMQQSCTELVRMIKDLKRDNVHIHFYPISDMWKKSEGGKAELKRFWGWNKNSNPDTRSAAYFLTLGCR